MSPSPVGVIASAHVAAASSPVAFLQTSTASPGGSTGGITGVNFGAAASTRTIIVALSVVVNANPAVTITAASIGGVTATIDAQIYNTSIVTAIIRADVPTGTSGTVSITVNLGEVWVLDIATYRCEAGATASGTAATSQGSGSGLTVTGVTDGFIIACSGAFTTAHTCAWTNATEDADFDGVDSEMSSATADTVGSVTITPTWSASIASANAARAYEPA